MSSPTDSAATTIDRPPVLDDTALFGHPRGLGLLFIVEMWERFSYYGMRGLLVLFLVNRLGWGDARAANLYGTYTALVYLTPLIGGYLADRFIGTRRSLVIGGVVIALGHFALAFEQLGMPVFYLGLGLIIAGTGFFKPNVSTMVGQIYREGDPRRDSGFTIFYMGINLGAFLAGIVCGWLAVAYGWAYGFGAAGVGMTLGLIIYMIYRDKYLPGIGVMPEKSEGVEAGGSADPSQSAYNVGQGVLGAALGIVVALVSSWGTISSDGLGGWFLHGGWMGIAFGAIVGAALAITILGSHGEERHRVIALFIVVFFVVFFWMAFEQAGSSMNLFADRNTDRVVGGFEIPTAWFQSINAGFIIIFAPLFAVLWSLLRKRGMEPSTPLKMVLGLALCGIGFLFMVGGGRYADAGLLVSPLWLTGAYLFQTWGELCLSPVGLSYVTKVAPWRFASLLMGVWFLANAAANKLAGSLAAYSASLTSLSQFYTIPVVTSIGAALLLLALVPLLKRLTSTVKA